MGQLNTLLYLSEILKEFIVYAGGRSIPNYLYHSAGDSRRLSVSVECCVRIYLSNNYNGNHRERKIIFHVNLFLTNVIYFLLY